jgi:hypothetical protein
MAYNSSDTEINSYTSHCGVEAPIWSGIAGKKGLVVDSVQ